MNEFDQNEPMQTEPLPEQPAEPVPSAEPVLPEATEAPQPPEPVKVKPEKRPPSRWVRFLRVFLGVLILLGLGAAAAIYTFYLPERQQLAEANNKLTQISNQSASDLKAANQKIDSLSSLETQNQDLGAQAAQAKLEAAILKIRVDVLSAQLAIANKDTAKARISLSKTSDNIQQLGLLLPTDQSIVADDLQSRLKLVLGEIDTNAYAANSDLDVLEKSLLELENALIK